MKKSQFTETQIVAILNEAGAGLPVKEICREHKLEVVHHVQLQLAAVKGVRTTHRDQTGLPNPTFGRPAMRPHS